MSIVFPKMSLVVLAGQVSQLSRCLMLPRRPIPVTSLTIASESGYHGMVPLQAPPLSVAATAQTFDGLFWNMEGCRVLASAIPAEAGASLPVQSAVNMAGAANGKWFIAYDGPAGSTGDWKSSVRAGDMIGFITSAGTGHITTCVSGTGDTAMLIDNITFVTTEGVIINSANDGRARDVIIQPAHPASQGSMFQAGCTVEYSQIVRCVACQFGQLGAAAR